jgi:hypothetical protein
MSATGDWRGAGAGAAEAMAMADPGDTPAEAGM